MKGRLCIIGMLLLLVPLTVTADTFQLTQSGMEYKDLKTGSGEMAAVGDVARMHFTGWLDDGRQKGKKLYNTRQNGQPVAFVIGTDRVMQGWNEGVIGMRQGGRRLLRVPPSLGYGSKGVEGVVPPDTKLIFIIDLLELEKR